MVPFPLGKSDAIPKARNREKRALHLHPRANSQRRRFSSSCSKKAFRILRNGNCLKGDLQSLQVCKRLTSRDFPNLKGPYPVFCLTNRRRGLLSSMFKLTGFYQIQTLHSSFFFLAGRLRHHQGGQGGLRHHLGRVDRGPRPRLRQRRLQSSRERRSQGRTGDHLAEREEVSEGGERSLKESL